MWGEDDGASARQSARKGSSKTRACGIQGDPGRQPAGESRVDLASRMVFPYGEICIEDELLCEEEEPTCEAELTCPPEPDEEEEKETWPLS